MSAEPSERRRITRSEFDALRADVRRILALLEARPERDEMPRTQRHSQPSDFQHLPDGTVVPLRAQRQP